MLIRSINENMWWANLRVIGVDDTYETECNILPEEFKWL
jgi:hypothetical protein